MVRIKRTPRAARPRLAPRRWFVLLNAMLVVFAALPIALLGPVRAAAELGPRPAQTVGRIAKCGYKCTPDVSYQTGAGQPVTTKLEGGFATYGSDVPILYNPANPDVVMTPGGWAEGRNITPMYQGTVAALAFWLVGAVPLLVAHRHRKFGNLRPGTRLRALTWVPAGRRMPNLWQLTFGDDTHASYLDNPATRDELRVRVSSERAATDKYTRRVLALRS